MCGIAGRLQLDGRPVPRPLIQAMCGALTHRGPDDQGVYTSGPVGLGHTRLSIIDLSPAGHQPMSNEAGTVWAVFNGEIYNFRELRRCLESAGWSFRSESDTEVLLRLYEARGVTCLDELRGMFAFAIWDARQRLLLLARDRLGVKPLLYRATPHGITFASELKALLQDPDIPRDVDPVAIHHFLDYQCVPAPLCAIQGVRKLPPAHYLVARGGMIEVHRYWTLAYAPKHPARNPAEVAELQAELRRRLDDAVRCRLVSDVPVGAFLSGGIDSSAVVALMSRATREPVRTFSIGFAHQPEDELPKAARVARHFHTDHTEFRVERDMLDDLSAVVRAYDEPFADSSALPTFILARLASRHVKVVLTGDGGDESFAGYDRHVASDLARRLGPVTGLLGSRAARGALRVVPRGLARDDLRERIARFADQLALPAETRSAGWACRFGAAAKGRLYTEEFRGRVQGLDSRALHVARQREVDHGDPLDAVLYADVMTYLPDCLLTKADIATMAHGLEARSPFLDHRLMEFAAKIPASLKLRCGETKWILRRALADDLPADILGGPKRGFTPPVGAWLRGPLREPALELLLGERGRSRGYFRPRAVQRLLDDHFSWRWSRHEEIWTLMMLELWHREFVDHAPSRPDAVATEAGS